MTDKPDPSFEPQPPVTAPPEAAVAQPAEPVRRPPAEPTRARSQIPEEPEAFHRWIEIEKLKVARKRLEYDGLRVEAAQAESARDVALAPRGGGSYLTAATLVLTVLLAVGLGYLAVQTSLLRSDVAQLRASQVDMAATIQTLNALAKSAEDSRAAPSLGTAQSEPSPPMAESAPPAPAAPALPATAAAPAAATAVEEPPAPELMGTGYTVRVFAPMSGPNRKRLDAFINLLKASGFNVDASDAGVVQALNNSIAYHASEVGMANKVASLLQSKYPALDFELRASPSIPEGAKRLFIMNLTEDAVN